MKGTKNRLYRIYQHAVTRCVSPRPKDVKYYAGVEMCAEWLSDFAAFERWALSLGYADHLTLDRRDGSAGYSPDNCRWATLSEQQRHTTRTVLLTAFGETKPMIAWAEDARCLVSYKGLKTRIRNGFAHETAICTPPLTHAQIGRIRRLHRRGEGISREMAIRGEL